MYTISLFAFTMGGNVVTLLTLDGFATMNKSSVLSFLVGVSTV
jgi:hypothetical protein